VGFLKVLFSRIGLLILIYFIIGVAVGPPLWPLGVIFHHAAFTL
jgi:hypothetical protein